MIGFIEGEKKKKGTKFKWIIKTNFPLVKMEKISASRVHIGLKGEKEISTPKNLIANFRNIEDKETFLKASRKRIPIKENKPDWHYISQHQY